MSNTKTVMGQAANTLVKPLEVEDVFSTYLYAGTGAAHTITNGIDLAGEGGLVWTKDRTGASNHWVWDTERGATNSLATNINNATIVRSNGLTAFNSNGFTLGDYTGVNANNYDFASWTFRKAPKFFDVVTYTGNGTAGRTIPHNLGSVPGMMIVKVTSIVEPWALYHREMNGGVAPQNYHMRFTSAAETADNDIWNNTAPTSSVFTVGGNDKVNANNQTYVAYLFAHNDGDGGFNGGDIIKCGSYTGNGSTTGPEIDLGFEPQWLLVKNASASANWTLLDVMRGFPVSGSNQHTLLADSSTAELVNTSYQIQPLSDGFQPVNANGLVNASGNNYIYMAIRRGTKAPESATEVFMPVKSLNPGSPAFISGFPVDMSIHKDTTGGETINGARLIQNRKLAINTTAAEGSGNDEMMYDFMNGFYSPLDYGSPPGSIGSTNFIGWQWKRAPGFFDVVAYTGTGSARTVSHNLGVAPEMMWVKRRNTAVDWAVYHHGLDTTSPEDYYLYLNDTIAKTTTGSFWGSTAPTDLSFSVAGSNRTNDSGDTYIAYLFATLPGISKVGSVSHTGGSATDVDCGFTAGCRFLILKRYDAISDWWVFDTVRGITSGNDARLILNNTSAETSTDQIDPLSSGFTIDANRATGDYIFYAIA